MIGKDFLPITREECDDRGWGQVDFVYVSGDAYVDHPSFGTAIITRVLENAGFNVAVLAQPDYKSCQDFKRFGRPRLGFLVSAGNIDSMVAHYTASKKRRSYDYYSPGGKMGNRPDRAVIVYCNRIREAYGDIPIIIGGLEASLRRFSHYDYWDNKIRRSVLVDSRADILTYGMGENIILTLAKLLSAIYGPRHKSALIETLAFGAYNKRFPKEEGHNAWLTADIERVADRDTNPFTSFRFSTSGYADLFTALRDCNKKSWYAAFPKELPTLVISGDADPVGNYGKGPAEVYRGLMLAGVSDVTLKMYEGARHELFNEYCRGEYYEYLTEWLGEVAR